MNQKIVTLLFYLLIAPVFVLTLLFFYFEYPAMHGIFGVDYSPLKDLPSQVISWGGMFAIYLIGNIVFRMWRYKTKTINLGYDIFIVAFIVLSAQLFCIFTFK